MSFVQFYTTAIGLMQKSNTKFKRLTMTIHIIIQRFTYMYNAFILKDADVDSPLPLIHDNKI